jgi:hypothetical protein
VAQPTPSSASNRAQPDLPDADRAGWAGRAAAALGALVLVVVVVVALGGGGSGPAAQTNPTAHWQKGANFTAWWHNEYAGPSSDQRLRALRATGSDAIELVVTWYQSDRRASSMAPDPLSTPDDESLAHAIAVAHALGMRVALKPHIDLHDGHYRGDLRPASPGRWFAAYRAMIDHYATLAASARAEMLVVGTELDSMTRYVSRWRALIAGVRALYGGRLTFAANWIGGAEAIRFWDALDYIGVDFYMPLGTPPRASTAQLAQAWRKQRYVQRLEALHHRFHRSVVFTEIGFASRGRPRQWPTPTISLADQRAAYQATYSVWSRISWFRGLYWWDWRAGNRDDRGGFDPQGHPAQAVMRRWNGAPPAACLPPLVGPTGATGPGGATGANGAGGPNGQGGQLGPGANGGVGASGAGLGQITPGPTIPPPGCPSPRRLAP